tara:strand:+ start:4674 stop:6935 length:2262 start_codon:yes stop_codon:yes gene_type:complete
MDKSIKIKRQEALDYHKQDKPGKLEVQATKTLNSQRDLSLAYSPGVAIPCEEIHEKPTLAYEYTSKGNLVAVITNGTAVLGLGNIGALASKPVMEGKSVLFKKFADIDSIDLEVDSIDVDKFINCVQVLEPSFGGINLEDIRAPDCFLIEQKLREKMNIPVFHDDQHGTAIITAAGIINAFHLTNRDIKKVKIVCNGAGAASIACVELLKTLGVPNQNIILIDRTGVIYKGRTENINQWKSAHAVETDSRTLEDALINADAFIGLSTGNLLNASKIKCMKKQPIIFAMANPEPEIMPDEVRKVFPDAIIATGRSDLPNQVNNVLGFPYIFRGALDVRATTINEEMKKAAVYAIANLARENVPDEVSNAYGQDKITYGVDYIIPAPFDPRLIVEVSSAVAKAAMDSGVATNPIKNIDLYKKQLARRLNPTASMLQRVSDKVSNLRKRIVFAEGEEERAIKSALIIQSSNLGNPILIGREKYINETAKKIGLDGIANLEIHNAALSEKNNVYSDFLFKKLQRKGYLYRDCQRMVNQDRNVFGSCMVAMGDADSLVSGLTRSFNDTLNHITRVISSKDNKNIIGMCMVVSRDKTVFIGDTNIIERPKPEELADIAEQMSFSVSQLGYKPRVAFTSFANFGSPSLPSTSSAREAVRVLENRSVNFEFDGEMSVEIALNFQLMKKNYPFCKLTDEANILVMPGLHSANISFKLLQNLGGGSVIGPILLGSEFPMQIVQMGASVNEITNAAIFSAYDSL